MALIKCTECQKEISDQALSCPHCGFPLSLSDSTTISDSQEKSSNANKISFMPFLWCVIGAIVFIGILIYTSLPKYGTMPEDIGVEHYEYGKKALDIVDQYIDNRIDSNTANNRLRNLYDWDYEDLPETDFADINHKNNFSVERNVTSVKLELSDICFGQGTLDELIEKRNALAEVLNEKPK